MSHIIHKQIQIKQNEFLRQGILIKTLKITAKYYFSDPHIPHLQIANRVWPHPHQNELVIYNILYQAWTKWVSTSRTVARDLSKGLNSEHRETKRRIHHCCRKGCCFTHLKMHLEKNEKYSFQRGKIEAWDRGSHRAEHHCRCSSTQSSWGRDCAIHPTYHRAVPAEDKCHLAHIA